VAELARALRRERPEVAGVVENLQPARTNVLVGAVEPDVILDGDPVLIEDAGVRLRLSPRAFFQANTAMATRLYGAVVEAAALHPGEVALDLYAGVGGIALSLGRAEPRAQVIGVEEVAEATGDAQAGAALNGLENVRFTCADAARFLDDQTRADVVVVDPPRKGIDAAVADALLRLGPRRIVYVSCAPPSLARDLARLVAGGYRVTRVQPFDLLPHTPHVEVLAVLDRA
jgi:23S rRNA (uracil1939-C5)-methyltransferase